jgi:hypothetical protein
MMWGLQLPNCFIVCSHFVVLVYLGHLSFYYIIVAFNTLQLRKLFVTKRIA